MALLVLLLLLLGCYSPLGTTPGAEAAEDAMGVYFNLTLSPIADVGIGSGATANQNFNGKDELRLKWSYDSGASRYIYIHPSIPSISSIHIIYLVFHAFVCLLSF